MNQYRNEKAIKWLDLPQPTTVKQEVYHIAEFAVKGRVVGKPTKIFPYRHHTTPVRVEIQLLAVRIDTLQKDTCEMLEVVENSVG
jgi:hypothetical protein